MVIDSAIARTAANALVPAIETALYAMVKRGPPPLQAVRQKEEGEMARMKAEIQRLVAENKRLGREVEECGKERKKLHVMVAILSEEQEIVKEVVRASTGEGKSQVEMVEMVRSQFREQFGEYVAKRMFFS
jgi:hypothetical protein